MKIYSWNVNGIRAVIRKGEFGPFVEAHQPDILCLQETKVRDDQFPHELFEAKGYTTRLIKGQPGYNGVAIFARHEIELSEKRNLCGRDDCRHIAARLPDGTVLHNFYVPAGGDVPDPKKNDKFAHKLEVVAEMTAWSKELKKKGSKEILVGDLNIAPLEHDVWSHKQLLNVVSHTPVETANFEAMREAAGWVDLMRLNIPYEQKLYTWWSYRAQDWAASNRGRRLDHVWSSPNLVPCFSGYDILRDARGWERPSDHVPVIARFDMD